MASKYWHRTSLTGGIDGSLDNIDGALLSNADKAYVATATAFYVYNLNATSGAAENSPAIISPDRNAGNKRWELVQSFASKTMATTSKTIGATGDYATHALAMAVVPDLLAHSITHTIQAGTTLTEVIAIKNMHGVASAAAYTLAAEKYYPSSASDIPTADSATATTLVDAELATAALGDDYFNGCWIFIVDGTGTDNGYVAITDYTDLTGTVTVASWPGTQPDATSRYIIVGALVNYSGSYVCNITYCTAPITILGIGFTGGTAYGMYTLAVSGQLTIEHCGFYANGYGGIYLSSIPNQTVRYNGVVGNNTADYGGGAGIIVFGAGYGNISRNGISDNHLRGILVRNGAHSYQYNCFGDNNGTWGTYAQDGATAHCSGTECSGASGNHSNGAGDGSLAY